MVNRFSMRWILVDSGGEIMLGSRLYKTDSEAYRMKMPPYRVVPIWIDESIFKEGFEQWEQTLKK